MHSITGQSAADSARRHSAMQRPRTAFGPHVSHLAVEALTWSRPVRIADSRDLRATILQISRRAAERSASSRIVGSSSSRAAPPRLARTLPEVSMRTRRSLSLLFLVTAASLGACSVSHQDARDDSARSATAEQLRLSTQLAAQKDSLTTVVLDADKFISQIDSQISRVKGLPAGKRGKQSFESPVEEQLAARKALLVRVDALVERAQVTAKQLAAARKNEKNYQGQAENLKQSAERDQTLLADLSATIKRQTTTIEGLTARVDSLTAVNTQLDVALTTERTTRAQAFYIIGREDELVQKGVIVREGGANFLLAHPGRTLQPARQLDYALFTPIDQREVREITVPDTTRQYRIVSRQSLDDAEVSVRDQSTFRGNLRIKDSERFWSPSRFLIIVQK
jgi:hypothetical protein